MKKILKSLAIFFPIILIIFITNLLVDPASLFNKSQELQTASALMQGLNVKDVKNMDDRRFITYYMDSLQDEIDCLVLGASRGLQISKETTGVESTFNAGVSGAELRDIISIYYMYKDKHDNLNKVILTLEPWTISNSHASNRSLVNGYYKFCDENNLTPRKTFSYTNKLEKLSELFSISYFQQSINPIFSGNFKLKKQIITTTQTTDKLDIKKSDGSYSYSTDYANMSQQEKNNLLYNVKSSTPIIIKDFKMIEDTLSYELEIFIQQLIKDGVEVTFFIPPILPEYYEYLLQETQYGHVFTDTQKIYFNLSEKYNIEVIGDYFLPEITENDFYDVLHPTYECVYNLFSEYRKTAF